jgi:hypothetical protein
MDLTVVIVCGYDPRVFDCIASLDVDVPVVVSLVPNSGLEDRLKSMGVHVIASVKGNYSISCNRGLDAVETSAAIIVDSDCILEKSCVERIANALDTNPLARATICFQSSPNVLASHWTSLLRNSVNNRQPVPAYTPGLGLRMSIVDKIGGYFFNERIFWGGDSEFGHRVQRAGLDIGFDPQAIVDHAPISLWHELRSGYKLGQGNWIQTNLGLRPGYETPLWLMRRFFGWLRGKNKASRTLQEWPLRLLASAWWCTYYAGYYQSTVGRAHFPRVSPRVKC